MVAPPAAVPSSGVAAAEAAEGERPLPAAVAEVARQSQAVRAMAVAQLRVVAPPQEPRAAVVAPRASWAVAAAPRASWAVEVALMVSWVEAAARTGACMASVRHSAWLEAAPKAA